MNSPRYNILLVDDEPRNLNALESILDSPEYHLVRAGSPDDALMALIKDDFAAIVLDVQMPGMSGFQLAELIKERKRTAQVPILFLTAYRHEESDVLQGYGTGAVDYLAKPVAPEILRAKIAVFVELYQKTQAIQRHNEELAAAKAGLEAEVARRQQTEEALRQSEHSLEQRVRERTADVLRLLAEAEQTRIALLSICEDQRRTAMALRESHDRLKRVLEIETVGVMFWDLTTGCMTDANNTFLKMMGYSRAEVETRELTWQKLTPPEYVEISLAEIRKFQATGRVGPYEKEYLRKDGKRQWFVFAGSSLGDNTCVEFCVDIADRKQAEQKLTASREQLRALLARLQRAREEERIRVSREVHDELGQLLTGLKMDVSWLERKLSEPGMPAALNPLLDRAVAASELTDTAIATVQKIAAELRPDALDRLGLVTAMQQEARLFQERSSTTCSVTVTGPEPELSPEVADELFYLCREALTNVARHARAANVEIRLTTAGEALVVEVRDDGVGLDMAVLDAPGSLGLLGMRERAALCCGEIEFQRMEPRGTRVTVRVPLTGAPAVKETSP